MKEEEVMFREKGRDFWSRGENGNYLVCREVDMLLQGESKA